VPVVVVVRGVFKLKLKQRQTDYLTKEEERG
jgi:hypothetical protein